MRKLTLILAALGALLVAAPVQAAEITGGTTTVTPSAAALKVLADNGIAVTALTPATFDGSSYTFPIATGRVNRNLRGYVLHRGGLRLAKGDKSITVRRLVVRSSRRGASVFAQVGRARCHVVGRHHRHGVKRRHGHGVKRRHGHEVMRHHGRGVRRVVCVFRFARVARLTDLRRSGNTVSATVKITRFTARHVNRLAGERIVAAGDTLGTTTIAATVGEQKQK